MRESKIRFIRQQGIASEEATDQLYTALMLQPRIVGAVVAAGVLLQSPSLLLALSIALWWSALVPTLNPFDAIYNHVVAYRRGLPPLAVALAPRRFAAGEAAAFALATAAALYSEATTAAWILEVVLVGGVLSAVVARFCIGAWTYHLLHQLFGPGVSTRPA